MKRKPLDTTEMLQTDDEFTAAYETHAKPIYRFLYWKTQDRELSEDLTSGVFEKAWRSRKSFKGGSVQAWLYRIARNSLTDHWRKKRDVPSEAIDDFAEGADDVDAKSEIDRVLAVEQLRRALERLPEDMRDVVQLRFIENLPAKKVSQQLGITENNVRIIQFRALRKLRGYLK
jgi:RNA polymerase sigma-70 factor, ECF subfamily